MFPDRFAGDVRAFSGSSGFQKSRSGLRFADRRVHVCFLAVMAMLLLFSRLHIGDLGGYDDAVYAHEGKQMLATGQWWSVYLNGRPDFDKPPMFIWLEAISMKVFGVSDFAAKFPSALLGFGTILLTFLLAREISDSYRVPIWAMLILLCTQVFIRFSMRAMTDVPFTFFFTLAILAYLKGLHQSRYFLLFGWAVSCAILMRSILGGIPLGIALAHLVLTGQMRHLRSLCFALGLLLAIGLPLIWFISQYRLHGSEFPARHFSFTVENLPLTYGKNSSQFRSGLVQYPVLLIRSYWPWLPLMLLGLWMQIKPLAKRNSASVLLVVWVVAVIVPFSLIHYKWLRYILPVFPAFSILAAIPICRWIESRGRALFPSRSLKIIYVVLTLLMAGMALHPKYRERPEELRRLAPIAEARTRPEQPILLYTERQPRDAHLFQLIWYANRYGELLSDLKEVIARAESFPAPVVIMDKGVFQSSVSSSMARVKVLAETEGFICWTMDDSPNSASVCDPPSSPTSSHSTEN